MIYSKLIGLLLIVSGVQTWAASDVVQIPDSCVQKMQFPCLVQADHQTDLKFNLKSGSETLTVYADTVVRLDATENEEMGPMSFELKKGRMKITGQGAGEFLALVHDQELDIQKGVLVHRENGQVSILNLEGLDFLVLKPVTKDRPTQAYQVIEKKFQARKEMLDYILSFPDTRPNLRKTLITALKQHDQQVKEGVIEQTEILQRKIASEEAEKEKNAKASQRVEAERKKSRQLFFQRTFER